MSGSTALPSLVEIASPLGFDETVDHLVKAIQAAGLLLFGRIDHSAGAQAAGLDMPPTQVLLYGHPKGGTPVMRAVPAAALDLPLRILVRAASPGLTLVAWHPVVEMLVAAGVPEELAQRLAPAQQLIRQALGT